MNEKVNEIFFSPGGTTKEISSLFCTAAGWNSTNKVDLLHKGKGKKRSFSSGEIAVVSMPVFSGRIPAIASEQLKTLRGDNTPVIAIVVYGNRDYDDALLELTDIMTEHGFKVIGAGGLIARHSIFPQVGKNRPDAEDKAIIQSFAMQCLKKMESGDMSKLQVKGNKPYRKYSASLPIHPKGNSACTKCGLCSKTCPVEAIDPKKPRKTDKKKCISCTACIYVCPAHARYFTGFPYRIANSKFMKKCSAYKKPELFV